MSSSGRVLSRSPKGDERASERTAAPALVCVSDFPEHEPDRTDRPLGARTDGRATDVEIASCRRLLSDLAIGMRNLRQLRPPPLDLDKRITVQGAKINGVLRKLFRLQRTRLL